MSDPVTNDLSLRVLDSIDLSTDINLLRDQLDTHRREADQADRQRKKAWKDYYSVKKVLEKKEAELKMLMDEISAITPDRKRKRTTPNAPPRLPRLERQHATCDIKVEPTQN